MKTCRNDALARPTGQTRRFEGRTNRMSAPIHHSSKASHRANHSWKSPPLSDPSTVLLLNNTLSRFRKSAAKLTQDTFRHRCNLSAHRSGGAGVSTGARRAYATVLRSSGVTTRRS